MLRRSYTTTGDTTAQDLLTVENDEVSYGLDDLLPLADALPIVLDLHHHWVATGNYIQPDDPRIATIRDSWRGTRPMAHISAPREGLCSGDGRPDRAALRAAGVTARDLRAHATRLWNPAHAAWAASHLRWTDLEVEAKDKNLASAAFAGCPPGADVLAAAPEGGVAYGSTARRQGRPSRAAAQAEGPAARRLADCR